MWSPSSPPLQQWSGKVTTRTFSGQCVLGAASCEGLEKSLALLSPLVPTGTWILACSGCTELCVCTAAT